MLDKTLCRRFADRPLDLSTDNGLLHASQIKYLVQTDVKILCHRKVLILYIYLRERAAHGDFRPLWTMFHARDEYITLARDESGKTKWRTAAFERLDDDYYFVEQCAFVSRASRERVNRYFHKDSGFYGLTEAQRKLLGRRLDARIKARQEIIRDRMKDLPALPRGLKPWVQRSVMPAYFFYDTRRRDGIAVGLCSSCGHEITLEQVKHNGKGTCPRCGRGLIVKSRGRMGKIYDRDTVQVLHRTGSQEAVVRIVKAIYQYNGDTPRQTLRENARIYVRLDENGVLQTEPYFYSYSGRHWKAGYRPVYYPYQENYEAVTHGHVYCGNLPDALRDTPWQYCPIAEFYTCDRSPFPMVPLLSAYIRHPRLEHLIKTGFYTLAAYVVFSDRAPRLDETRNRTHQILQVGAEDVAFLRSINVDAPLLEMFQAYCGRHLKDRQKLLLWQIENGVKYNVLPILDYMTVHKFLRYIQLQHELSRRRLSQYHNTQSLVSEYHDYLDMCRKEHCDMTSNSILYPKDLQKAHDRVARSIKLKANAQMRRDFKAVYRNVKGRLDYEREGMKIVCPASADALTAEGNALHHCVGGYVQRVADHECMIVFLRRCEEVDKPFYTVEVRKNEVVQVRGLENKPATPEVQDFIDCWTHDVLQPPALAAG